LAQSIEFTALSWQLVGAAPFKLNAVASSGLPVNYNITPRSVARVEGDTVTVVGEGTATITASQPGDATYLPATPVSQVVWVYAPVAITVQPQDLKLQTGQDGALFVEATGTGPLVYQWRKDGVELPEATQATLKFTGATTNLAGVYEVLLSNAVGEVRSREARVRVESPVVSTRIAGILVTASSELVEADRAYHRRATNVVNGVYCDSFFWESVGVGFVGGQNDPEPQLNLDLGGLYRVDRFVLWNGHEDPVAVKRMEVLASEDGVRFTPARVVELELPMGCPPIPQEISLSGVVARHLRFRMLENHSGTSFPVSGVTGVPSMVAINELEVYGTAVSRVPMRLNLSLERDAVALVLETEAGPGAVSVFRSTDLRLLGSDPTLVIRTNTPLFRGLRFPLPRGSSEQREEYFSIRYEAD